MSQSFDMASPEEIRAGKVSDVYFLRGREILLAEGENPNVVAEIRAGSLPREWPWGVLAGLDEAIDLLEGRGIDVEALPEGSVFYAEEPVLTVTGPYLEFGILETALLGFLCQASGIATAAARCKLAAEGRPVYSFGARRMHPGISPMIERAAYIGGCDGVSSVKSGELIGREPVGTMAHALTLILGEERAWRGFDRVIDPKIPRVALIDTFQDEKFGAVAAAAALGQHLAAVRLDTPASRRGDFVSILREVRWELDARGYSNVKIFVSGGIDERSIRTLNRYADAYGVGGAISNGPVVDFALDIVEIEGAPRAKRGKLSGSKHLWICPDCGNRGIAPTTARLGHCPRCGHRVRSLLESWIEGGRRRRKALRPNEIREVALGETMNAPDPFGAHE
ncbi:MAG TPA: nicotinate phosphoribosyltransferase [Actinobacteria bacterium]|jgi:nicotinate phosphoribosyltransferase|nr:nicotinate phosphoribosyltransferase [Actinomycetota bacterium]